MTTTTPATPDLLTIPEAAECARVSDRTLREWIARGYLPTVRPGSHAGKRGARVFVRRSALDAYLDASTTTATAGPLAGRRA